MVERPKYQTPPTWIGPRAWGQGHLTGLQVLRIAAWKNARSPALLTLLSEKKFHEVTAAAMEHMAPLRGRPAMGSRPDDYWEEWGNAASWAMGTKDESGLLRLKGVGYPVASAILCILDPEVWPVIDKWSVRTVSGVPGRPTRWYGWKGYRAFARHLADEGPTFWPEAKTIHDLDQRAMNASKPGGEGVPPGFPHIDPP